MPALLAALGAAFSWVVSAIVAGLASELFRKAVLIVTFNLVLGYFISWVSSKLPIDIFNLGPTLDSSLSGLPQFALYLLSSWGIITAIFIVVNVQLSIFGVRLLLRAMGAAR
ncbi:MAG: hypothetical protein JKY97_00975 [Citromicrobium sp.]|nr:hypothetical protein [Citromicrobium sp.]